jgi:S1-C subfamily serine protease
MMSTFLLSVLAAVSSTSPALGDEAGGGGELKRGAFFGAKVAAVSDEVRERLKLDAGLGVTVDAVILGSTAADTGLLAGDVVVAVDGVKVAGPSECVRTIAGLKEGAALTVEFRRGEVVQKIGDQAQGPAVRHE